MEERGGNAVVTGGGSGIGRGIALALAEQGMNVVVADLEADSARAVAEEVAKQGVGSLAVQTDVTDLDSLARLRQASYDALGEVHLLSNNAGVMPRMGPLAESSDDDWLYAMSVNLHGIVRSVNTFLPDMRERGIRGHIQNTASMAGLLTAAVGGIGIYTTTKWACVGYSLSLRGELAEEGIGVSVLCPGMIASNLASTSARNRPARYGGPLPESAREPSPELQAQMMPAEECGRITVRAIRANRGVIVTHPATWPLVEAVHAGIRADFEAEAAAQAG